MKTEETDFSKKQKVVNMGGKLIRTSQRCLIAKVKEIEVKESLVEAMKEYGIKTFSYGCFKFRLHNDDVLISRSQ